MTLKKRYREHEVSDGKVAARITGVREIQTESGLVVRISAAVESADQDINGVLVTTLTGPSLASGSRLARIFEAATGRTLGVGEEVDLEDLIGQPILATVENRPGSDGRVYPQIMEVEQRP